MNEKILVLGGRNSGKSLHAEMLTWKLCKRPVYIATSKIIDKETKLKVDKHKLRRKDKWQEYDAYLDLIDVINRTDILGARLVDCITWWLNNLVYEKVDWEKELEKLIECIKKQENHLIFVSNEIGLGVIPDNKMSREFSQIAAEANKKIASAVNRVDFIVSGIPIKLKG